MVATADRWYSESMTGTELVGKYLVIYEVIA